MRRKVIAVALVVVPAAVVVVAGWALLVGPRMNERSTAESDLESTSNELIVARASLGSARAFDARGDAGQAELDALRGALPEDPAVGSFVTLNEQAARSNGVAITSVVPEEPASTAAQGSSSGDPATQDSSLGDPVSNTVTSDSTAGDAGLPPGVASVAVTVSAAGADAGVRAYIASLSELPRLVLIDDVSTAVDGDGQTSVTLLLSVLYQAS